MILFLIYSLPRLSANDMENEYFKTWVDVFSITNTFNQKLLYFIYCSIFFVILYLLRLYQKDIKQYVLNPNNFIKINISINFISMFIAIKSDLLVFDFYNLIISILIFILIVYFIQGLRYQVYFGYLMLPIFVFLFGFYFLVPFNNKLFFDSISTASFIDMHLGATVTSGYLMDYENYLSNTNYGIGVTLLIFLAKKVTEFIGFNFTQIGLVSIYQVIGFLLILLLLKLFKTSSFFFFASILVVINIALTNMTINILTPNQSMIRYFTLLLQIVIYYVILKKKYSLSFIAPVIAIGLILSPPLGLIFCFGVILNQIHFSSLKKSILEIVKLILWTSTLSVIIWFFTLEIFNIKDTSISFWLSYLKGFGGFTSTPSITFYLLLIIFSNLLIIFSFYKTNVIDFKSQYILFLCNISMMWLFYYVNRMFDQNLWFLILILSLIFILIIDEFLNGNVILILVPTLISIMILFSYEITSSLGKLDIPFTSRNCQQKSLFPDFCFSQEVSLNNDNEFRYILSTVNPDDSIILTGFPSEFRVLGYNRNFPYYTLLADTFTNSDVVNFSNTLNNSNMEQIILHTNQDFYFYPPMLTDYISVLNSLNNYKKSYSVDNFDIYKKISN
jgi:hypothetical protein